MGAFQSRLTAAPVSIASIALGAEYWAVYPFYFCQLPLPANEPTFAFSSPGWGLYQLFPLQGLHAFKMASLMPLRQVETSLKDPQNPPPALGPPLYPRVAKAKLPRFPLAFAKTAHPSRPTLPEYVVDTSGTRIVTLGTPRGCPPRVTGCSCFPFRCTMGLTAKRGPAVS